ncbi:ABC transporter permease [Ideonella livida]|uniref:ABC transporter permease subunit n=1 Tax=Ideonella livida TaxID=2707176 RepID=A0A7C9PJC2_9BURK|nr:ABC transporter permease subunit [Ideonella livida]NDY92534.1 ABC transporter permease subunit [Ideonella livida]
MAGTWRWRGPGWAVGWGVGLLLALAVLALLGPVLGADPRVQDLSRVREAPSARHWLGTDLLGRDQFSRLTHALRLSLSLALGAVALAAAAGTALGLWAAWRGGWADGLCRRLADAVQALPALLLVLLVAAVAPGAFWPLYAGLVLCLWVEFFRVVRVQARQVLAGPPVEASRLLGFGSGWILRHHVVPALAPVLLTQAALGAATTVLALSTLGFVGVGLQPPAAELGVMLVELLPSWREAPWLLLPPLLALAVLSVALLLLADALGATRPMESAA